MNEAQLSPKNRVDEDRLVDLRTRTKAPIKSIVLWAIVMVGVIIGELLPGNSQILSAVSSFGLSDKALHFGAYLLLSAIPSFGFERRRGTMAALSMVLLGVVLEFAQRMVPGRDFEIADMVANALGVLAGLALTLPIKTFILDRTMLG